jgi:hypothetical protein
MAAGGWFGQITWPTLDKGGLDALDAWLRAHPRCRLVIIDTLKKIRPIADVRAMLYNTDYDALGPLTELGQRHRCCVLTIHHSTKAAHDDFVDELSGSIGLSGASETILGFRRDRGSKTATLLLAGRDLDEERELALQWDGLTGQWVLMGDAKGSGPASNLATRHAGPWAEVEHRVIRIGQRRRHQSRRCVCRQGCRRRPGSQGWPWPVVLGALVMMHFPRQFRQFRQFPKTGGILGIGKKDSSRQFRQF